MTAHTIAVDALLAIVVATTWIGVTGMLRMRAPMQALHYLSIPGTLGITALTAAIFVETGASPQAWKTLLIAFVLLGFNSVVTHATARALRVRDLGHWQPQDGDPIEFLPQEGNASEPRT